MHPAKQHQRGSAGQSEQTIMLVDDHVADLQELVAGLVSYGINAETCAPEDLMPALSDSGLAAVVLGPAMKPVRMWELCREVRRHADVPVIAVLEVSGPDYLSMALDAGADAAFTGSLDARLVLSALQACRRREVFARKSGASLVEAGSLRIDLYRKSVEVDGVAVALTATEFGILAALAQQPGRVISASEIVQQVHGYDVSEGEAQDIVKVHVSRLRQKLEAEGNAGGGIANVRGQGYMYLFERRNDSQALEEASQSPPDSVRTLHRVVGRR